MEANIQRQEIFSDKYLSMKMDRLLYSSFNKFDLMVVIKGINIVTSISDNLFGMNHNSDNKYYPASINRKVKNNIKNQIKTYEPK